MSLPAKAIDRLFERLNATYGSGWTRQWADVPVNDVKTAWAYELSSYAHRLDSIAWALDNLPEHCPNAIQFRNLCRSAPAPEVPYLPEPVADPDRLKQELSKLGNIRAKTLSTSAVDHKAWAKRLKSRHEEGEILNVNQIRCYRAALGIES